MSGRSTTIIAAAWLLGTTAASAHHSVPPVYDGSRTVTVAGVVTAFRLVNPHALMAIDVADDAGKVVSREVEFDGRLNLTNGGWNESPSPPAKS